MINIKGATKHYGEGESIFYALKDINVEINKEELVVILGPSGSGKSTLLNILGGIDRVDHGEVFVDEIDIARLNDNELTDFRADKIGFVFQFYNLIPNLTIEENIEVVSDISEKPFDIDYVLDAVGLLNQKGKFPKQLSGGQQQRVAIARALAKNPKLLLCDEPTGALDYNTGKAILKLLQDTCRNMGMTVVVITHNLAITPMGDKIIKVRNGKIQSIEVNPNPTPVERIEW